VSQSAVAAEVARAAAIAKAEEVARAAEAARAAQAAQLAKVSQSAVAAEAARAAAIAQAEEVARAAEAARALEAAKAAEVARAAEAARAAELAKQADAAKAADAVRARAAAQAAEAQRHAQEAVAATAARLEPPAPPLAPAPAIADPMQSAGVESAAVAAAGASGPVAPATPPARTTLVWGAALLVLLAAALLWWRSRPVPEPVLSTSPAASAAPAPAPRVAAAPADAAASAVPAAAPAPANVGRFEVLAIAGDATQSRIARELAAAMSAESHTGTVVGLPAGAALLGALKAPGRLAMMRYDALRTARGTAAPPLRVLTPLFPEAVLFVVRADSPLKSVHDLKGRRLSIGPAAGDDARTVRAVYRGLFGAPPKDPPALGRDAALAELVAFRSIDAMAVVVPDAAQWWASLDPGTARRLRLLVLDQNHPTGRSLLKSPGMATLKVNPARKGKPTATPAVMTFLVASGDGDADVERLTAMARSLCQALPRLREQGHPQWRDVQFVAPADTGWPVLKPFQSTMSGCSG
jgi:hypothetical protein